MKIKYLNKGMTLIEVIISIALLSIISIVVFAVYTTGMFISVRSADKTKNISAAAGIAENSLANSHIVPTSDSVTVNGTTIYDVQYIEDNTAMLVVTYNGSSNTRPVNITKVKIDKSQKTVNNNTIQTEIEVYKH